MTARRTSTTLLAAVLLAVALLAGVGPAAPASAAGPGAVSAADVEPMAFADCPSGVICIYIATNGGGLPGWTRLYETSPGRCTFAGIVGLTGLRGVMSAYNRTDSLQKLWTGTNCTGSAAWIYPGNQIVNLGTARWSVGG
ncbi:peptidase inhibitor family I36 protein [Phytomonospora endophytica]|uniref:Peptidase inhibitor family I36 n=1 Tax=Phytomonospora endophytica TaxID=714109 RepID=A0A841FMG9_9ACTN|nr:peptidase inhibitor family I36 protein [Phytomonospora endophytica]MBB6037205.1 hypothetical protein [Phytomonospora endophytica]GIG71294.1 hypothetical protein Pen01_75890 [Phytomonospora endophytica]